MIETLILVRHGIAEPAGGAVPDALRSLTDSGRAALAADAGFARTFALLSREERRNATVWASTALRAQQTAQTIVDVIGERPIIEKGYLFDQDEAAFIDDLGRADASCLIAVGHIPCMNRMVEYLAGKNLAFTPGAAACLHLNDTLDPYRASLAWFVEGPTGQQA